MTPEISSGRFPRNFSDRVSFGIEDWRDVRFRKRAGSSRPPDLGFAICETRNTSKLDRFRLLFRTNFIYKTLFFKGLYTHSEYDRLHLEELCPQ